MRLVLLPVMRLRIRQMADGVRHRALLTEAEQLASAALTPTTADLFGEAAASAP